MSALSHSFAPFAARVPVVYPDCTECDDAGRFSNAYCDCDAGEDARECDRMELSLEWIGRNRDRYGDYSQYDLEWYLDRFTDAEMISASAPRGETA